MNPRIEIFPRTEFPKAATEKIADVVRDMQQQRDLCHLVLTGGSTPRRVYSTLATKQRERIDWQGVHLYWGDERMVPPEHSESNYCMAKETLLDHVPIPQENVHRMRGEIDPRESTREYAAMLQERFDGQPPVFDLVLLGVGEDGHTASLFPETSAVTEKHEWVTSVFVPKLKAWRVTLTLPVINQARETFFLISGSSKAEIVQRLLSLKQPSSEWPASLVQPESGNLTWLLDKDAAARLNV